VLLAPEVDLVEPVAAVGGRRLNVRQHRGQRALGVAHDLQVRADVLAHLAGVDVDVDEVLGLGRPFAELGRDTVVDPHPDHHQDVRVLDGLDVPAGAHEAGHVQRQRMAGRKGADAQQGRADGSPRALGDLQQLLLGVAQDHPVPGQDDRPLGLRQELDRLFRRFGVGLERRPVAGQRRAGGVLPFALRLLRVLADVDQDRPRPARGGDVEGLGHDPGDVVRLRHQVVVLGHRLRAADDVGLLEGVGADSTGGDLAGDGDHGHGVHEGGGQAGDHVQRSGPRGRHRDAGTARGASVAVSHVGRALLVADEHVLELGVRRQPLVDRQVGAAGVPEDDLHALALEGLEDHVSSSHRFSKLLLEKN